MKKNEKGILSVETSIVLTCCVMLMLFLFSFARVYSAQSAVSHAVLQASDAVALESYLREICLNGSEEDVVALANRLTGSTSLSAETFKSLREADVATLARQKFISAVAKTENEADEKLKKLGVKNGVAGVDFSSSYMDLGNDDVVVFASYVIKMQFPVFGFKEIPVTKAAKSKTFGDILFGIETISEDPTKGSASGGGSYKYGTQVEISATPKYGYEFAGWTDGNNSNPRTITVAGSATYVAKFRAKNFGISLESSPAGCGNLEGAGEFLYLDSRTIKATALPGYTFKNWSIYRHEDKTTTIINSAETMLTINQTYTCTANFQINSYAVNVKTEGVSGNYAGIMYNGARVSSVTEKYNTALQLSATADVPGYRFLGWKVEGASNHFETLSATTITVPANNVTYVACYESTMRTVRFYGAGNQLYCTRVVEAGKSLGGNMPGNPKSVGSIFRGWNNGFHSGTVVYNDMDVYSSWSSCSSHRIGTCGVSHNIKAVKLSSHKSPGYTNWCQCIVCADCGVYLRHNGSRWVTGSTYNWTAADGSTITLGQSVWCVGHVSPTGGCSSYMDQCLGYNTAGRTYNPH